MRYQVLQTLQGSETPIIWGWVEQENDENIVLDYDLSIQLFGGDGLSVYWCPKGAEFFIDEHGVQWVKFVPNNGYHHGREHIVRTDTPGFMVVKA